MLQKLTFSGDLARACDHDRFFLSLLLPAGVAQDIWPLLAFNYEISRTREVVTDTTIGLIRLQWWRDAIKTVYEGGAIPGNEVVGELSEAIRRHQLAQEHFDALLYAREFDLEGLLPASLEGLTNYADYTHTPLLKLCLAVMKAENDPACRDVAVAYVLAGLLRSVLFHARQQRCYLPSDVMASSGASVQALYDLKPDPSLPGVIRQVHQTAWTITEAAAPCNKLLKGMRALTRMYLTQMKSCGYDPYNRDWIKPPAFRELRVMWAAL